MDRLVSIKHTTSELATLRNTCLNYLLLETALEGLCCALTNIHHNRKACRLMCHNQGLLRTFLLRSNIREVIHVIAKE